MSLKIVKYHPCANEKNNVVAYVSFYIPEWGLYLNGCRYIRKKNGGFFVSYPSKKLEVNGEEKYFNYYQFEGNSNTKFQDAAHKSINDHLKKTQQEPEEEPIEQLNLFG